MLKPQVVQLLKEVFSLVTTNPRRIREVEESPDIFLVSLLLQIRDELAKQTSTTTAFTVQDASYESNRRKARELIEQESETRVEG